MLGRVGVRLYRGPVPAQGQVQVDPLHQALGLHPQQRRARRLQGQLLLLHHPQVHRTDAEADLGQFQGTGRKFLYYMLNMVPKPHRNLELLSCLTVPFCLMDEQ